MPSIDIDSYRASFSGGAKAFLFYYKPTFPSEVMGDTESSTYLVRATTLPETAIEEITTNWQGFDYRFAGKYTLGRLMRLRIYFDRDKLCKNLKITP